MASVSIIYRKDKLNAKGEAPIHFRIIKDRKISYISSGIMLPQEHWDSKKNCIKAKHTNSARFNEYLTTKYAELQDEVFEQETHQKSLTSRQLRDKIYGKKPSDFFTFADDTLKVYLSEGKISTHDRGLSIINKLKEYVKHKNIAFQDITVDFLNAYEKHLSENEHNCVNTINANFRFIRKIFNDAYNQELIEHHLIPFNKYKMKTEKTERVYLSEEELTKIEKYSSTKYTKLNLHRDMFVFAAYTGLRVSDMLQLQWKHFDGQHINFIIKKTGTQLSIKLPNKCLDLLNRYKLAEEDKNAFIFTMLPANLDLNNPRELHSAISKATAYINKNLDLMAIDLELDKHISFHISRHTFATRALRKGISIDKVSKLMGHAQIRETQIYAKIVSSELDKAMDVFND
jgi:integrase